MKNLKEITEGLFEETATSKPRILSSLEKAEHTIELDYRGRYFFELLQNARDAAAMVNEQASIKIIVEADGLYIANTGSPFSEDGLIGICSLGHSTKKDSRQFIGNKGLGFKSILEITATPRIVTPFGTVFFDREAALPLLQYLTSSEDVPLLFLPMYEEMRIDNLPSFKDYSTLFILPFREGITANRILEDFNKINIISYSLLGNFSRLELTAGGYTTEITVSESKSSYCEVRKDNVLPLRIKFYKHQFVVPGEEWNNFSADERKLVSTGSILEITIGLKVGDNNRFIGQDGAPLYLYYPLEERSGFRFFIHALFAVTPNRKQLLAGSRLNELLLREISSYLSNEFLAEIDRDFRGQEANILAFLENKDNSLHRYGFYARLRLALKNKPVIWSDAAGRLLRVDEFFLLRPDHQPVFKDPKLGQKYLIYLNANALDYQWLISLGARVLDDTYILAHIDVYASLQLTRREYLFFNELYRYVPGRKLSLKGKKVLLTEHNELVDNSTDVYYGGQRKDINIPPELARRFTFLHESVKQQDFRFAAFYLGGLEYNTDQLAIKAMRAFLEQPELRGPLLLLLCKLNIVERHQKRLMDTILVPVSGRERWAKPLMEPIYWPDDTTRTLFPQGALVDVEYLQALDANLSAWKIFLLSCNVSDIPGLYLREVALSPGSDFDYILDIPDSLTQNFDQVICRNYSRYVSKIDLFQKHWPFGKAKTGGMPWKMSSFIKSLRTLPWLYAPGGATGFVPANVLILPISEQTIPQVKALAKYFTVLFRPDADISLLQYVGTLLPRNLDMLTAIKMFRWARERYEKPPQETDFVSAWNRLYGYFFDFWRQRTDEIQKKGLVIQLKTLQILAETTIERKRQWIWERGENILYVDDKPFFDDLTHTLNVALPAQFTKRDRNEIGVVLNKVGIPLSKSVQRTLAIPEVIREADFCDLFLWGPFAIAILEDSIGTHLDEVKISLVKKSKVRIVRNLRLNVKLMIGERESFPHAVPFHIGAAQNDVRLLLLDEKTGQVSRNLAEAIQGFFESIVTESFDIKLAIQELSHAQQEEECNTLLNQMNIDITRVFEIREALGWAQMTIRELFWNAVAQCVGIPTVAQGTTVTEQWKSISLSHPTVNVKDLLEYDEKMQLNGRWNWSTLSFIRELLSKLIINTETMTPMLIDKVDLHEINKGQLVLLIESRRGAFVAAVYHLILEKQHPLLEHFLEWIDQYDHPTSMSIFDTLQFDPQEAFDQHLGRIAMKMQVPAQRLAGIAETMDEKELYKNQLRQLQSRLQADESIKDKLNLFLNNKLIKSLLCFNIEQTLDHFRQFLLEQQAQPAVEKSHGDVPGHEPFVNNKNISPRASRQPPAANNTNSGRSKAVGDSTPPDLVARNGSISDNRTDQAVLDKIGRLGEYYVYCKLLLGLPTLQWVSVNAVYYNKAIVGDDNLHFDMKYIDKEGREHFIEVKSTSGTMGRFSISRAQVIFGLGNQNYYHLYFVTNALNSELTRADNLGTIFRNNRSVEDFENSDQFQVVVQDYRVTFMYDAPDTLGRELPETKGIY